MEEIEITETTKRKINKEDLLNRRGQFEFEIDRLKEEIIKINEQIKLFKGEK